jgi:hypothetical protein
MFLLVAHFDGDPDPDDAAAVSLLAAQPTCRRLRFARSTENATVRVLVAEFDSAAGYRTALSPFDVRTLVVPWLSRAQVDSSGVFEVVDSADGGRLESFTPTVDDPGR